MAQDNSAPTDSIPSLPAPTLITTYIPAYDAALHPPGTSFLIASIVVKGNKKTKPAIILREVPFKTGMIIPLASLIDLFQRGEQQLMNTTLFHTTHIYASRMDENCLEITVEVAERWYLFPFPFFDLVDRNFNQWIVEHRASLQRVNYGVNLLYNNVTGHNDRLRVWLINGYTNEYSFAYEKPYFDRRLQWGFRLAARTGRGREINYATLYDKQAFLRASTFLRWFSSMGGELNYRPKLYARHTLGVYYYHEKVSDTVAKLNPAYLGNARTALRFPEIYYQFSYAKMDYIPYPREGFATTIKLSKLGLSSSFNRWQLHWQSNMAKPVGVKGIFTAESYVGVKVPFQQPFINRRFLGYDDIFMHGFEYNVIDGVVGGYLRVQYAREIARINFLLPGFIRKKATVSSIPFRFFAKIYSNTGYVYSPSTTTNRLQNSFLQGSGIGIDVLSLYDVTIRIEYSFNNFGQNGLFLHRTSNF